MGKIILFPSIILPSCDGLYLNNLVLLFFVVVEIVVEVKRVTTNRETTEEKPFI